MPKLNRKTFALSAVSLFVIAQVAQAESLETIRVTSEQQSEQAISRSVISAKEIAKAPVVNDVAEVIRHQPGVTFDSGAARGSYGNKRQINIRAMGPENTLILIDGKPVTSRNSERYTRKGSRNTFGDSNWVPVEEIESVEVIRGTDAARYGSGAMGGVVNIKTKAVSDKLKGSISYFNNTPEDSKNGNTNRVAFNLSAPIIKDVLGFRIYGGWAKRAADEMDINSLYYNQSSKTWVVKYPGREGMRNKDIAGRLTWKLVDNQKLDFDVSYGRQGNIFTGENESNGASTLQLAGRGLETIRLYRQAYSITHEGKWSWGENKTYVTFDKTKNSHLPVSLVLGSEGSYTGELDYKDSLLKNLRISNEFVIPFTLGVEHSLTVGAEYVHSRLDDAASNSLDLAEKPRKGGFGVIPGINQQNRSGMNSQKEVGVFVEDKISATDSTTVTPMVRYDHHSSSGSNWSGSLNISQAVGEHWSFKAGVARAYKAPNLYQSSSNYVVGNRYNGCPINNYAWGEAGSCYLVGKDGLKPEHSWNKEIGFEYQNNGYQFGLTYFHNDYRNKIEADNKLLYEIDNPNFDWVSESYIGPIDSKGKPTDPKNPNNYKTTKSQVYQWGNIPRAIVEGFEGSLQLPLIEDKLKWGTTFTYIRKSINKTTGNPLSMSPKYTISSTLTYQPTDNFDFTTTYTRYGKQITRPNAQYFHEIMDIADTSNKQITQYRVGSYGIWGASAGYKFDNGISIRAGISNILDKKLYRNGGAQTYNEMGRAYYTTLKYSF